jgi:exosortase
MYSLVHESSTHIFMIPFIVAYLLYFGRETTFAESKGSSFLGISILATGVVIRLFGSSYMQAQKGNNFESLTGLALVLSILGSFLLSYGNRSGRKAIFPLLFLFLMIPIPDVLLDRIVYLLQSGSTTCAYIFFKALGVPVIQHGFLLSLSGITIEVAKECSGIRSSVALFITSLLAAYIFLRGAWKRSVFVLLAICFSIVKNGIRITTLTLLATHVDPGYLTGRLHREGGFVFFVLTLAMLAPVLFLLHISEAERRLTGAKLDGHVQAGFAGNA